MGADAVGNDTRGWIMCIVSGIACVAGASIVCVDIIIRQLPGKRNFRIQDSNVFLACSLSLSFGVMIFSALYSMLPSAIRYLDEDNWSKNAAAFIAMGCFTAGFFGIQIISRLLHQLMPSHVVDCDHTHQEIHDEEQHHALPQHAPPHPHSRRQSRMSRGRRRSTRHLSSRPRSAHDPRMSEVAQPPNGHVSEATPLLPAVEQNGHAHRALSHRESSASLTPARGRSRGTTLHRRPSMLQQRVVSFFKDTKTNCDEEGPCFGYSDPCGQECFKHIGSRSAHSSRAPTLMRTTTGTIYPHSASVFGASGMLEEGDGGITVSPTCRTSRAQSRDSIPHHLQDRHDSYGHHQMQHEPVQEEGAFAEACCPPQGTSYGDADNEADDEAADDDNNLDALDELEPHHHHVPTNAFLAIGLQTVIAIALHKFPEGFITYATNHANPTLGFNVFMALFVHNIAEGFAMALPLYMALGSRLKAILAASVLGGLSQPMGAALAVAWFKLLNRSGHVEIDNVSYACIFAVTAGTMTSVALQLFVESLSLNHNRNLSMFFAFLGMLLLGVSNSLVEE